jgi:DNA-directed RNA polymerase specialized sigma24 family protein
MDEQSFAELFETIEPRLRRALIAWYGPIVGREAAADALSWAWEHRQRLDGMGNIGGYLFRVGQSAAKRDIRWRRPIESPQPADCAEHEPSFEPRLDPALATLSGQQRAAVLLVHGYGYSCRAAADLLGVSLGTLRTHLGRGLDRLRHELEVSDGVSS